jgi:ribonuclease J
MVVRLAPGPAAIVDAVPSGRIYKDGDIVIDMSERALPERRKLAFTGIVSVAIAIDKRGEIAGDPVIDIMGIPDKDRRGGSIPDLVAETVGEVLDSLPKARRRDPEAVEDSVARAIRSALRNVWGKKPACHVLVVEV